MSDTDTDTNQPQIDSTEADAGDEPVPPADVADEPTSEADAQAGDAAETDEAVAGPADESAAAAAEAAVDDATQVAPQEADAPANGEAPADADAAEPGDAAVATDDVITDDVITDEELLAQPAAESPYDRPGRWFVVHTQSGYEKKVKQNLEARIVSMNAEDAIYEVVIPMEDYVDFRNGKRIVAQRKMFPGYLLVRAELDDQAWFVIRNTPGVTGFVGQGAKPSPLPRRDVESFLMPKGGTEEQVAQRAKPRLEYEIGETVRVKEGPFADFSGEVIELNEDQLKLKVLVNIFGRETPVELEFSKVAKL
ncbi:MAG: transcription termination/antitermination protein NusG [Acidimicrobiales bacterium]